MNHAQSVVNLPPVLQSSLFVTCSQEPGRRRAPLFHANEFVEVAELAPLGHDEVAVLGDRSAVRRVRDGALPLMLRHAETRPLLLVRTVAALRYDVGLLVH